MQRNVKISKWMAWALRHNPEKAGIKVDSDGWANLEDFVMAVQDRFPGTTIDTITNIVRKDKKGRYQIDGTLIRATQGHSVSGVDAMPKEHRSPPEKLYHGTTYARLKSIKKDGAILKMRRHHVHLSVDVGTAMAVACRHRSEVPIVLEINAKEMVQDGFKFRVSENDIWMVDSVPVRFVELVQVLN